jgi:hypothetical protein
MDDRTRKIVKIIIILVFLIGIVIVARWGDETTRGIMLLLLAACVPLYLIKRMIFRLGAQKTVGKIVSYPRVGGRAPSMNIEFTTLDGKQIQTNVTIPVKRAGSELTIYYDPNQPTRVSYPLGCLQYLLFGFVFFLFFFLGVSFFV